MPIMEMGLEMEMEGEMRRERKDLGDFLGRII
jgi:hypothetical protein